MEDAGPQVAIEDGSVQSANSGDDPAQDASSNKSDTSSDSTSDSDEEDTAASLQNPEQVQFDEPDEEAKLLCEQLSEDLDQLKLDYEELERLSDERVQKHPVYLQLKQECDQAKAENDELKERIRQLEARV